jgi:hypothetical protein
MNDIQPSTKMKAICTSASTVQVKLFMTDDLLNQSDLDDSTRKTVIFCNYVQMLRLVGVYLSRKRVTYRM